jgi:hypothetical protein
MTLVEILEGANVALRVIQERLVLILCMLMTFGMFAWAMWLQSVLGAIIAAAWGILIFLPVLITGRGEKHGVSQAPQNPTPES